MFHGENDDVYRLTVFGEDRSYRRLQVLEFDSDRKRMSVIIQFPDDSIWLLCKGAESSVIPRCTSGPVEKTLDHVNDYALVTMDLIISLLLLLLTMSFIIFHVARSANADRRRPQVE